METVAHRMKRAMTARGVSQSDLSRLTGIGKSSISTYLSGAYEPKQRNLYKLARALKVDEAWLMGHDVPMERPSIPSLFSIPGVEPLPDLKSVPHLGSIACGLPILAEQNIDGAKELPDHIDADFVLTCKGDSMIDACIRDGDQVFIRAQPDVEDGEIAAVLIGEEATLKRVYKIGKDRLELRAENRAYPPLRFSGEELGDIRILGKAVYFSSVVR
jgi:repressor LexA